MTTSTTATYTRPRGTAYYPLADVSQAIAYSPYANYNNGTIQYYISATDGLVQQSLILSINTANLSEGKFVNASDISLYNPKLMKNEDEKKPSILYTNGQLMISLQDALRMISINNYFKRLSCAGEDTWFFDARTQAHYDIAIKSAGYSVANAPEWTMGNFLWWKTIGGDEYIHNFKIEWIRAYKNVIKDAAATYDIPELLLAGVAYVEVAGDPMWVDMAAYAVRNATGVGKDATKTSFGYVSMQVEVAAEVLGYRNTSSEQIGEIIASLQNPTANLFITAKHLSNLRNIDFSGVGATQMSNEQISITATRYNLGGSKKLETIKQSNGYGQRILENKDAILEALR